MLWLTDLLSNGSTANTIVILAAVIATGVAIGKARAFGVSFGIGGVMFAGLLFGHFQLGNGQPEVLHFIREFGLILFVYTIGIEIGPAFFASFKKHGLRLNLLALGTVLAGFAGAGGVALLTDLHIATVVGIMSGAVTNTPGLGVAQQTLSGLFPGQPDIPALAGLAYAMTYPFGILGVILSIALTKRLFRIDLKQEKEKFRQREVEFAPNADAQGRIREEQRHPGHANIAPVFLGVFIGLVIGAIPIPVPGLPAPLRLGMAGGPLLVALILGRLRQIGRVSWYMHPGANRTLREIGIAMFLGVVGLTAGGRFAETIASGDGLRWMAIGAGLTMVPLACMIGTARVLLRENYLSICGVAAGSMTNPPALSFATHTSESSAPALAFATVYALTLLMRILGAQLLILLFT